MPRSSTPNRKSSVVPFAASAHYINNLDKKKFTPPPFVHTPVQQPTFGQVLKEGFAFGAGQSVAHNVVNSIFGKNTNQHTPLPKDKCSLERDAFENCIQTKHQDFGCENELSAFQQCKQTNGK